jgi:hypothetical protein
VIAGDVGNQTIVTWADDTDHVEVVVGIDTALRPSAPRMLLDPRDQYGNDLAGRRFVFVTHVMRHLANGTVSPDAGAVEISDFTLGSNDLYTADVTSIFPMGSYTLEVEIVRLGIRLPSLTLTATQEPCNASRNHVPSEVEAGCVCAVRLSILVQR